MTAVIKGRAGGPRPGLTTFSSMMTQKLMQTAVPVVATWELFLIRAQPKAANVLTVITR